MPPVNKTKAFKSETPINRSVSITPKTFDAAARVMEKEKRSFSNLVEVALDKYCSEK